MDCYANFAHGADASAATLDPSLLVPNLASLDKIGAIKELVDRLHSGGYVQDSLGFLQSVLERETLQSTILDEVALPHARCASVNKMGIALGVARPAIDYPSGDERTSVHVICLLAVPADVSDAYLTTLSSLARIFSEPLFVSGLVESNSAEEVRDILLSKRVP